MSCVDLYPHQEKALNETAKLNRVAYFHDMGLGKTYTGSEKMIRLGAKVNLLICQKSKINDWKEHFANHYKNYANVYDLTKAKELSEYYGRAMSDKYFVIGIINYELAWRRTELLTLTDFTLMLDESSLIQNRKAKQTKFILKLRPKNVILLSGTPTSGKYENLWTQAHLLGWNISEDLYQRQYVNWTKLNIQGGQVVKVVDKRDPYRNVDRLKSKLREHGADFLKTEEVMNLPEQTFIEVNVPKSKEYVKFMKDSLISIKNSKPFCEYTESDKIRNSDFEGNDITEIVELVGDTNLTKRLYARQLCGQYSNDKLSAFKDLISSTNDRIIVFYNFTEELHRLIDVCVSLDRPYGTVNGQVKDTTTYEYWDNSITFVQYQAGAMGLNLQKANKIIYFSLPERSELFEQSKKRIHRIGQDKPCFYYIMTCDKSVETSIYEALKMRKDFTDELFREVDF